MSRRFISVIQQDEQLGISWKDELRSSYKTLDETSTCSYLP